MTRPNGIAGLEGSEAVGAVLSLGVKGPRGNPIERDRFHLVVPHADSSDRRPHHEAFSVFNAAPAGMRRSVIGHLVHRTAPECFEHQLRLYVRKGGKRHPSRRPFCTGDGVKATRWDERDDDGFGEVECPHDRCEFRQGMMPECKPWMRLAFRIGWRAGSMPAILVRFNSGSWHTTRAVLGFFEEIERQAAAFRVADYSLAGIGFMLTVQEKTSKKGGGRKFPAVTMTPTYDPAAFFAAQMDWQDRIESHGAARPALPAPVTDDPDAVVDAEYLAHMPGEVT
jgi:hypothetical protein